MEFSSSSAGCSSDSFGQQHDRQPKHRWERDPARDVQQQRAASAGSALAPVLCISM